MTTFSSWVASSLIAIAGFSAPIAAASSTDSNGIRVGTQNLWHYPYHYEERLAGLKDGIAKGVPQIMGFQEAWRWFGSMSLFDEFAKITGDRSYFYERAYWGVMHEGIGLASAYPVLNSHPVELPHSTRMVKRLLIDSVIQTPIGKLHLLVTHLNPKGDDIRKDQIAFIAKLIQSFPKNEALIFMGDLNDTIDSGLFQPIQDLGLRDVADGKLITYDPHNPYADGSPAAGIDHIFYRANVLEMKDAGLLFKEKPISDHYGVWAEFGR